MPTQTTKPKHPAQLIRPSHVALALGLWLVAHAAVRIMYGSTLGMDDAEQALSAQAWSWGYRTEQPPLFTWMLLLLEPVFGRGILPIAILRYGFLALFCFAYWHAAIAWLEDRGRAVVAVSALPAIFAFGWYAQVDLTHSTVLAAAMAILLWLAARLTLDERPAWSLYVLLGLTMGLGMLGKWNLVMAGASLAITSLVWPDLRRAVLHPGSLLAVVIVMVIVLPNALWILEHKSIGAAGSDVLVQESTSRLHALLDLALALVAFPQPWLIFALLLLVLPAWRRRRAAIRVLPLTPAIRILGTYVLVAIALHALLVIPFGGVDFSERWMIVPLLPLPILLAAYLDPDHLPLRRWLVVPAILIAVALGLRIAIPLAGGDQCSGRCRALTPFDRLGNGLEQAGFSGGTIVTRDLHMAGNLRVRFPQARIVEVTAPAGVFGPPFGNGQCLLVWNADADHPSLPTELAQGAVDRLGVDLDLPSVRGTVNAPFPGAIHRRHSLGYVLFPGPNGECR